MTCETYMERYGQAKAVFEDARSRGLANDTFRPRRYYLAFLQRDAPAMQEQLSWAVQNPKSRVSDEVLNSEASAARYFGHVSSGRPLLEHADAVARSSKYLDLVAAYESQQAVAESLVGNLEFAREAAKRALAFDSGDAASPATATATLALALAGGFKTAENSVERITVEWPQATIVQNFDIPCIRAAIAIRQMKPADAIRFLEPATQYELAEGNVPHLCPSYMRGLAYLQAGQAQQAATEFQRVIEHPGIVGISLVGPLARLQLARAQAMMGDKDAARKSYQDFLTLWKDADPDIPVYKQAKAEYARLR